MYQPKSFLQIMAIMLLALVPVLSARAQEAALAIVAQPEAGPPGTTVTIAGRGAAPNTAVDILAASFRDAATCHLGRGADVATTVTADANGRFTATHHAERINAEHVGIIYVAKVAEGAPPRPDSNVVCFSFESDNLRTFPETRHTVRGRFLEFWEQHGGLPIFGYPVTERSQEDGREVQYFERRRFEAHPQNARPYDVLLGRLGDELLRRQGIDWQTLPPVEARPECLWFGQTQRNVCDQGAGVGFRSFWLSHGLEFDGRPGASYEESLALFGYPLTEARTETNPDGDNVLTQWFERARFEWHPGNPDPFKVLLGRLGAEVAQGSSAPTVDLVNIYLIALEDNGKSGKKIGCNDSVVPVELAITPTTAPLTTALERLFAIDDRTYGESGLYNALHGSDLTVERIEIQEGKATIHLGGQYSLGGVCDNPRFEAQIRETALQFSTIDEVAVFINGRSLEDIVSLR